MRRTVAALLGWVAAGAGAWAWWAASGHPGAHHPALTADGAGGSRDIEEASLGVEALATGNAATVPGAERAAEGEALVGRVESALDGAQLAGFGLVLFGPEGVQGRATSDAEGRFVLLPDPPLPAGPPDAAVHVQAPAPSDSSGVGWEPVDAPVEVTRGADGRLAPLVVRAAPTARAAFARTLVDEVTGEPVPFCEVRLDADGWGSVSATSDARGVVRTRTALPSGPALVHVVDHPLSVGVEHLGAVRVEVELASAGAPNLAIRVGATCRLALDSTEPLDPSQLVAALRHAAAPVHDWRRAWTVPVRVEGDGGPWVRLRPFHVLFPFDDPAADGPYVLEVRDEAGGLYGSAELPRVQGVHPNPLVVRVARVGAVRGRVFDGEGAPLAGARVSLFDGVRRGLVLEQETATNGAFVLTSLPAGEHTLRVFTREHGTAVQAVALAPGESRELSVTLVRRPVARVAGTARTTTGAPVPAYTTLRLTPRAAPGAIEAAGLTFHTDLVWDPGARIARFDFGAMPVAPYLLEVLAYSGPPWEPPRLELPAPSDSLELVCRNDLAELPLVADGPSAPRYLRAQVAGVWLSQPLVDGRVVLPTLSPQDVVEWALLEAGKRAARGDGWQLERATEGPHLGALLARAPLEAGYSRVVRVREGDAPMQGVSVRVDGVRVGVTAIDGGLLVDAQPTAVVALDLAGYRIGAPEDDGFELRFAVERE